MPYRLPALDGIRAIAIALVVLFHARMLSGVLLPEWIELPVASGWLGVDLFFFLSGVVLTLPYTLTTPPSPRAFFTARYIKIVPSYYLCLFVLAALCVNLTFTFNATVKDFATHLVFIHNLFNETHDRYEVAFWSIAPEVQFYVILPFIIGPFMRRPWLVAGAMIAVSIIWRWWAINSGSLVDLKIHELPAYLDIYAAGMVVALAYVALARAPARPYIWSIAMCAGVVGSLVLMHSMLPGSGFPNWTLPLAFNLVFRTLLGASFACATLGALLGVSPVRSIIGNTVMRFIATISYNLYLWHIVVDYAIKPYIQPLNNWPMTFVIISTGVSIIIATIITFGFERPLLKLARA